MNIWGKIRDESVVAPVVESAIGYDYVRRGWGLGTLSSLRVVSSLLLRAHHY